MLALYVTFGHENFVKGPANLFIQALADLRLDGLLTLIAMTYGRLGDLLVLLRYPEQLQGTSREFNAQLETASLRKMKDWRTLLLQYLLQQNRSVTGEDKVATDANECKQYCGMPLLTDLAVMMRIDPLALVHGLREFVTVAYGPVMSFAFPDVQVKAYRNSVLYVDLVSVVDCSVLNWVEQRELRGLASDDRLIGRIAEPGWVLMDFNDHFKCRMGREDLSHIQFNPKLWNLRPLVKDTGEAMRVPQLPGAYTHAKESQQTWLPGSRPQPDQCPRYPPIRRMLLGVTSPIIAPRIGAFRDAEKRMLKWSEGMEPRFISWKAAAVHTFDFSFPDAWSRKKIKALPSRRPEVSAETWNEVHSPTDDLSRLKWPGEVKVVMLEVARESRGGSYITMEDLAPHGEEFVEFLVNDELFYHAGDMTVPARPDSGIDARQGPSGPKPKPDADNDELMDARTQQVLVDQLFSVPKCVRLARMSERSYDLLAKIFRAVPKRSEGELQDVVGEEFLRLNEGNVSEFQKQKASGALPTEFPTIEEKDDLHRILMEVEPLLGASGYGTRRNIVRTHGEYPCHCLAQTLWYPKRGNLMLVWDVEELYSTGLPDQNQQVSIVVKCHAGSEMVGG